MLNSKQIKLIQLSIKRSDLHRQLILIINCVSDGTLSSYQSQKKINSNIQAQIKLQKTFNKLKYG